MNEIDEGVNERMLDEVTVQKNALVEESRKKTVKNGVVVNKVDEGHNVGNI